MSRLFQSWRAIGQRNMQKILGYVSVSQWGVNLHKGYLNKGKVTTF